MIWTRESTAARSSTSAPVPSGDPSSTMSTSRVGDWASTASMILRTFSRSLYVGMMTSPRSGTFDHPARGSQRQPSQGNDQGNECHSLSILVRCAVEPQFDLPTTRRQFHANQGEIGAADVGRLAVHRGRPARIVIFADD